VGEARALADPDAREPAVRELFRGRLGIVGPTTAAALAGTLDLPEIEAEAALVALEAEGVVLRGRFTPRAGDSAAALEWCDRRLLARIHRYTLNRLRAEIEPVSRRTSCASCSPGRRWIQSIGWRGSRGSPPSSPSSMGSRCRRRAGRATSSPHGSRSTIRHCSIP